MTEKVEYEIFEQKIATEKIGNAIFDGDRFVLNMEGRCFFLKPIKPEESIRGGKKKKYNVRDGYFVNKITEKVRESYQLGFKKETIKELSQILNEHYQSIVSPSALLEKIKPVLEKYGYENNMNDAFHGYVKYFVIDGLLKRNGNVYEICKNNLIPKREQVNRGFLDELGMS